jgi:hypothetical protein
MEKKTNEVKESQNRSRAQHLLSCEFANLRICEFYSLILRIIPDLKTLPSVFIIFFEKFFASKKFAQKTRQIPNRFQITGFRCQTNAARADSASAV